MGLLQRSPTLDRIACALLGILLAHLTLPIWACLHAAVHGF